MRCEPLGARRRTCQITSFTSRVKKQGLYGSLSVRHFFWSKPDPLPWFSRITRHETRITAFYRVLRPSGGEKCRLGRRTGKLLNFPASPPYIRDEARRSARFGYEDFSNEKMP